MTRKRSNREKCIDAAPVIKHAYSVLRPPSRVERVWNGPESSQIDRGLRPGRRPSETVWVCRPGPSGRRERRLGTQIISSERRPCRNTGPIRVDSGPFQARSTRDGGLRTKCACLVTGAGSMHLSENDEKTVKSGKMHRRGTSHQNIESVKPYTVYVMQSIIMTELHLYQLSSAILTKDRQF